MQVIVAVLIPDPHDGRMAELKNELKWSHSRQSNWNTCRRLYYLSHYAHWGGWKPSTDARTRQCYILTKMVNLPMLAGSVVHKVIETVLKDLRAGSTRPVADWVDEGRKRLNEGWKQSRDGGWKQDPKRNVNLFEHFHGLEVGKGTIDRTRERVTQCIENFFATGAWSAIRETSTQQWECIEELESFNLGDFGVWVKIDFAMKDCERVVHLFDWKTGREDDAHRDQLMAYALFARRAWRFPPDRIRLVPVYLREGTSDVIRVKEDDLKKAEQRILGACEAMANACDDPVANSASIENFPMVEDRRVCARCFFQSVCYEEREWPCKEIESRGSRVEGREPQPM
jgi:hypothetical protein